MPQEILYNILLLLVQAVIVVVGGYLVNYLRAKVGAENLNKYSIIAKLAVTAIEQTFGAGNGSDKKEEAVQLIKKMANNKLTDEQINSLIESAVFEMNNLIKGPKSK